MDAFALLQFVKNYEATCKQDRRLCIMDTDGKFHIHGKPANQLQMADTQ